MGWFESTTFLGCPFRKRIPSFFLLALLDDLDKELNNYIMRCREWYGWHFPELGKIITDNLTYCKCVRKVGEWRGRGSGAV